MFAFIPLGAKEVVSLTIKLLLESVFRVRYFASGSFAGGNFHGFRACKANPKCLLPGNSFDVNASKATPKV